VSELSERRPLLSKVLVARASILFFAGMLLIPLVKKESEKLGAAIDVMELNDIADEVDSPSPRPGKLQVDAPSDDPLYVPPARRRDPDLARPIIPIDPNGGEAEYTLDPLADPTWAPGRLPRRQH
jgi:hypothetical protein